MIYFTTDTHFGDRDLKIFRPTQSVEEWDEFFLDKINTKVGRNDSLYILGDFAEYPNKYRYRIRCKNVYLILGNHDHPNRCRSAFGSNRVWDYRRHTFSGDSNRPNMDIVMFHYPMMYWDRSHKHPEDGGTYHLSGHHHDQRTLHTLSIFPEIRWMDVAPEVYYRLYGRFEVFSIDEVYAVLKNRRGHDPVEFYLDYQERVLRHYRLV